MVVIVRLPVHRSILQLLADLELTGQSGSKVQSIVAVIVSLLVLVLLSVLVFKMKDQQDALATSKAQL